MFTLYMMESKKKSTQSKLINLVNGQNNQLKSLHFKPDDVKTKM